MITKKELLEDIARALGRPVSELPADLSDSEVDLSFAWGKGTTGVKRSRRDLALPSYKVGRSRRTPLCVVVDFKLSQIKSQYEAVEDV